MRTRLLILLFLLFATVSYAGMTFTGMIWNKQAVTGEYYLKIDATHYLLIDATHKLRIQ